MHFCSRYRNFNSLKEYRIIFANNNWFKCVFFNNICDVFVFENVYEY